MVRMGVRTGNLERRKEGKPKTHRDGKSWGMQERLRIKEKSSGECRRKRCHRPGGQDRKKGIASEGWEKGGMSFFKFVQRKMGVSIRVWTKQR